MKIKPGSRADFELFMQKQAELYASHVQEIYGLPSSTVDQPHAVEIPIMASARNLTVDKESSRTISVQRMIFIREKFSMFNKFIPVWVRVE